MDHLALFQQNDSLNNNDKPVGSLFLSHTSVTDSDDIFPATYIYLTGLMLIFISHSEMTTSDEVASFCFLS